MKALLSFVLEGKEVSLPVELTDELKKVLLSGTTWDDTPSAKGWGKPEVGHIGYYSDERGLIQSIRVVPSNIEFANSLYQNGNYFTDRELATITGRANVLLRNLRRHAILYRKKKIDLHSVGGYTITYNYIDNCLECGVTGNWLALGDIVFDSEESAREAMNQYASELIWYFTEAKPKF